MPGTDVTRRHFHVDIVSNSAKFGCCNELRMSLTANMTRLRWIRHTAGKGSSFCSCFYVVPLGPRANIVRDVPWPGRPYHLPDSYRARCCTFATILPLMADTVLSKHFSMDMSALPASLGLANVKNHRTASTSGSTVKVRSRPYLRQRPLCPWSLQPGFHP